jgi:hypothetical protein
VALSVSSGSSDPAAEKSNSQQHDISISPVISAVI